MTDYFNDEEFSEMQNIIKQEEIRMLKYEMRCVTSEIFIEFIKHYPIHVGQISDG